MKIWTRGRRRVGAVLIAMVACMLLAVSTSCSDSFRRSGPSDQVSAGTLCLPSSETCPNAKRLVRDDVVGTNQIDYELSNLGDVKTTVRLRVLTPSTATEDVADAGDTAGGGTSTLVEIERQIESNSSVTGRLSRTQLTTRDVLVLTISCDECDAELDYAFTNEPLECGTDEDCTGPWVCLENSGRCVECESSEQCDPEQTCSQQTNRCEPPSTGGCSTPGPAAPTWPWIAVAAFMLVALVRRASLSAALIGAVFLTIASPVALPSTAEAAEPPRATFGMGIGPRWFTGELGSVTKRGIGLNVDQELRWRHFGAAVQLGTRYHLTTQQPPPLSRELQVYTVAAGPRAYFAVGDVSLMATAEYQHVGLVSNSLVRLTGSRLNYGSAGGSIAARYTFSFVELGLRAGFHPVFGLDGSLVSVDLTVRLAVK